MKKLVPVFFLLLCFTSIDAQDTLPKFSVRNIGNNKIVVSWVNALKGVKQISIQRSSDSLKNYKTILTVPDPTVPENGFVDTKASNDQLFYRLYIMQEKGVFFFSPIKKPVFDSSAIKKAILDSIEKKKKLVSNGRMDKLPGTAGVDSLKMPTIKANGKEVVNSFIASKYVYTMEDGYVRITLPEGSKKYSIKFFDEKDLMVLEVKDVPLKNFKIDKSNFYHSGWFKFELYEDGKLFEKHRFLIPKEF
jgi:hypothetical protein